MSITLAGCFDNRDLNIPSIFYNAHETFSLAEKYTSRIILFFIKNYFYALVNMSPPKDYTYLFIQETFLVKPDQCSSSQCGSRNWGVFLSRPTARVDRDTVRLFYTPAEPLLRMFAKNNKPINWNFIFSTIFLKSSPLFFSPASICFSIQM